MSIWNAKEKREEAGWKVNKLLQMLKRPERMPRQETGNAPAEQEQRPAELAGGDNVVPLHEIPHEDPENRFTLRENQKPLEMAYEGDLVPGETLSLYLFLQNTTGESWQGLNLHGDTIEGFAYVPGSTTLDGVPLPDEEETSPLLSPSGFWIPFLDAKEKKLFTLQLKLQKELPQNGLLQMVFTLEKEGNIIHRAQGMVMALERPVFSREDCGLVVDSEGSVSPGQMLSYTLSLKNSGKGTATGIFASVKKLQNASYVPATTTVNADPVLDPIETGALFTRRGLYLPPILPGERSTVTFKARVNYPLDKGEIVQAFCEMVSDQTGILEMDPVKVTVQSSPRFVIGEETSITASPNETVKPGDVITYTFHYRNTGNANAYGATFRVKASPLLEFVPGSLCILGNENVPDDRLVFYAGIPLGTITAGSRGAVSFRMAVKSPAENGSSVEVKSFLSFKSAEEIALPPVIHVIESTPFFADPKLCWIEVHPKGQVEPETLLTYTLHFKNKGNAAHAHNVRIRAGVSPQLLVIPGSLTFNGKKLEGEKKSPMLLSSEGLHVGKIPYGTENLLTFQARVNTLENGTALDCFAEIEADGIEPYSTLPLTTMVAAKPDFSQGKENFVEAHPAGEVAPGDTVTYTVHFQNRGPVHARQVILSGQEPTHTRYIPNKTKFNGIPIPDEEKISPLFSVRGLPVGPVQVGDSGTATFQVKVDTPLEKGTVIRGQIKISVDDLATYLLDTPPLVVRSCPDFSQSETNFMEVFPDSPIAPGQTVTYVLYYKNTGNESATQVLFKAHCPQGTAYVKGSTRLNGIPVQDENGTSPLLGKGLKVENVKWNGSGNISFQVKALEAVAPGTVLECCGSIRWAGKEYKTNTVRNTVKPFVDFSNKKQNHLHVWPQGEVKPGTVMTYTFRCKNEGAIPARQTFVKISLSPHVQYLPNSTVVNGQPVIDTLGQSPLLSEEGIAMGDIPPGQSGELSLRGTISRPLDSGTEILALSRLKWNNDQRLEFEPVRNTVRSTPLFSDKRFNYVESVPDQKNSGTVTCIVYFKNTGDAHAHNAIFRGKLPLGWKYVPGTTCVNGRVLAEEETSPLFSGRGLFLKKIEAEEEGNFSFQLASTGKRKGVPFPVITVEAQQMETQEFSQKE